MGIEHQRIVQFNHYVCRQLAMESPRDTNRLRYFIIDLIYKVLEVRLSLSVTPRNLPVETFVRIDSRILMSNAFFCLEITIYEVLLMFRESLFGLEPAINSYQFPVYCDMNIINVTVRCNNCCIVCKMNKAHLVWGSMHVIYKQNKKHWTQHWALRNT